MIKKIALLLLAAALGAVQAQNNGTRGCQTFQQVVCNTRGFDVVCAAARISGMDGQLTGGNYTLFAPTNAAFRRLPQNTLFRYLNTVDALRSFVLYHTVLDETIYADDLECGSNVTMANGQVTTTLCRNGSIYQMGLANRPRARPEVVITDLEMCSGVIHGVNQILLPLPNATTSPPPGQSPSPTVSPTPSAGQSTSQPSVAAEPTTAPSMFPTLTGANTTLPSIAPTVSGGETSVPTSAPSIAPTASGGNTSVPTTAPSIAPTVSPVQGRGGNTRIPTDCPRVETTMPTTSSTSGAGGNITGMPTTSTSEPSLAPTQSPVESRGGDGQRNTTEPTLSAAPTLAPTRSPVKGGRDTITPTTTSSPSISFTQRPVKGGTSMPSITSGPSVAGTTMPSISSGPSTGGTTMPSITGAPDAGETAVPSTSRGNTGLPTTSTTGPTGTSSMPTTGTTLPTATSTPTMLTPTLSPGRGGDNCSTLGVIACGMTGFESLCLLVNAAGLTNAVPGSNFTMFAPNSEAFQALPDGALADIVSNIGVLRSFMLYHMIPDRTLSSDDLECSMEVIMANGLSSETVCRGGNRKYQVGPGNSRNAWPQIVNPDIAMCGGVVHEVDHVLLFI